MVAEPPTQNRMATGLSEWKTISARGRWLPFHKRKYTSQMTVGVPKTNQVFENKWESFCCAWMATSIEMKYEWRDIKPVSATLWKYRLKRFFLRTLWKRDVRSTDAFFAPLRKVSTQYINLRALWKRSEANWPFCASLRKVSKQETNLRALWRKSDARSTDYFFAPLRKVCPN